MVLNFLVLLVHMSLITTIAFYAIERLGAAESLAGITAGCFVLGALTSRLFLARFIDRIGRRRTILVALAAYAGLTLLYAASGSVEVLITLRTVHGAAFGVAHTALTTSVMAMIPASRRAEGTGYYGVASALVMAVGPFVAVTLSAAVSLDAVFMFVSGVAVAALLIALFLRPPEPERNQIEPVQRRVRVKDLIEPAAVGIGVVALLSAVANAGVIVFLAAYTVALEIPETAALFFVVFALATLASRIVQGRVQDRHGDNVVIYPLLALIVIGLLLIALVPTTGMLLVAAALLGAGHGGIISATQAIAVSVSPPGRLPIAVSTFYVFLDAGAGLGPVLVGALLALFGFTGMYAAGAGAAVLAAIVYTFVHARRGRGAAR